MEHRWGKRIFVEVPILVVHVTAKRVATGHLRDISLGGALILSPWELNIGARIQVRILSAHEAPEGSLIDASVVRRSGPAIGIEWLEFAPPAAIDLVRAESARRSPLALVGPNPVRLNIADKLTASAYLRPTASSERIAKTTSIAPGPWPVALGS